MIPTFVQTSIYSAVLALFSSGANGVFLDANDWGPTGTGGTGVVFQDLSGTPVTAMEQPVQLILDKSQGLKQGPELVTNGGPFTDTTGWVGTLGASVAAVGGELRVTSNGTSYGYGAWTFTTVVGKLYKVTGTLRRGTCTSPVHISIAGVTTGLTNSTTSNQTGTFYFFATSTSTQVICQIDLTSANGDTAFFNNITCKSIAGNHAYVSASANRPIITARYNRLTKTEDLTNAVWGRLRVGVPVATTDPQGGSTAFTVTAIGANGFIYQTVSNIPASTSYVWLRRKTGTGNITLFNGTVDTPVAVTGTWAAFTMAHIAAATGYFQIGIATNGDAVDVWHPDFRDADQATGLIPTYQRVNTATDYDWSPAFPPMIRGNGSNQYLTGNLDLSSTNKVTVWAGVRKTSDAVAGMVFELSANATTNAGAVNIYQNPSGYMQMVSRGTATDFYNVTPGNAPVTSVLSMAASIPSPYLNVNLNGVRVSSSTATQGTGNYGSYPFYVFSRAGTSLFWNGGFNMLILVGKAANDSEIRIAETYCNQKLRAY